MGRLLDEDIESILERAKFRKPHVYIETGTWMGTQLQISARHFPTVLGVELDEHWFNVSHKNTEDLKNVHLHCGDTREILPKILNEINDEPVFIVLDAHYCATDPPLEKSEFPLWTELELLRDRKQPDIVSVDDVHTFGVNREDLRYSPDSVEWESVTTESILDFFGDRVYNSEIIGDSFVLWMKHDRTTRYWNSELERSSGSEEGDHQDRENDDD